MLGRMFQVDVTKAGLELRTAILFEVPYINIRPGNQGIRRIEITKGDVGVGARCSQTTASCKRRHTLETRRVGYVFICSKMTEPFLEAKWRNKSKTGGVLD